MNITISADTLCDSLKLAILCAARGTKATPQSAGIHLIAGKAGELELATTDSTKAMRVKAPCSISEPGSVCVNAGRLFKLACAIAAGPVKLKTTGTKLEVAGGPSRFMLHIAPEPTASTTAAGPRRITVDADTFHRAFAGVSLAAKSDPDNTLSNVCAECSPTGLTLVATDGRRLHSHFISGTTDAGDSFLIPAGAAAIIAHLCKGAAERGEKELSILPSPAGTRFTTGAGEFYHASGTGRYPEWRKVVPVTAKPIFSINRSDFLDALTRAEALLTGSKRADCTLIARHDGLRVVAKTEDSASEEFLAATVETGFDIPLLLDLDYLAGALKSESFDIVSVKCDLTKSETDRITAPILIGGEGSAFNAVVMPKKLDANA